MKKITYKIFDELDFHRIIADLEDREIPFSFRIHESSNFPSMNIGQPYAEIEVDEILKEIVKDIIEEGEEESIDIEKEILPEALPESINSNSSFLKKRWQVGLLIYAIVMTIIAAHARLLIFKNGQSLNFETK